MERQYAEDLEHKDGDIHRYTAKYSEVDYDKPKLPQNPTFEYFPDKHQQGHDHRLGFMPFAITWYDERHDYWKGTWQNPKKKEMRIKDLRSKWWHQNVTIEDDARGNRRGKTRHLHATTQSMFDTRYFDPNVLRIGNDWMPFTGQWFVIFEFLTKKHQNRTT